MCGIGWNFTDFYNANSYVCSYWPTHCHVCVFDGECFLKYMQFSSLLYHIDVIFLKIASRQAKERPIE